jgi:hypothetical protein
MPTPEEIFMKGFEDELSAAVEPEMPILEKLAKNLELDEEQEVEEMPVLAKLAANLEGTTQDSEEIDLSGMTDLEKLAFMKWAEGQGIGEWVKEKAKAGVEKVKGALKGKEWTEAEKGLAESRKGLAAAQAAKPTDTTKGVKIPLLFGRKKALKDIAAKKEQAAKAHAGATSSAAAKVRGAYGEVEAAKGKRMAFGKKVGIGAGAAGGALLTAAIAKKLISGRKKAEGSEAEE